MCSLVNNFTNAWNEYGAKHGLDTYECITHAIRHSIILVDGQKPAVFDWRRYLQDHPDLQRRLAQNVKNITYADATCHYLNHGLREKRRVYILGTNEPYIYDFDWKKYDELNPDVFTQRNRGDDIGKWHCFRHWCEYGYNENRRTGVEKQLSVNNNASISIDEDVNKLWRETLNNIINQYNYNSVDELIKFYDVNKKNHYTVTSNYKCINIENIKSYAELLGNSNGDNINESNFIKIIQQMGITLYFNNVFISGNKTLLPEITISRNKEYYEIINKNKVFLSGIPYKQHADGLYFITQSMIESVNNKNSLLYPHVYEHSIFNEISNKPKFLHEQALDKNWYNWASEDEIKKLRLKHFNEGAFVICICGRIAINSYPKSLLEAIKLLRAQGYNIHLLALTKFEVSPHRLTQNLYDEITSYDWVKSFTVDKKDVLNYFRICDILASTYRDYCNHVGGSNKIKEYLLCDKPILCSRGKERERELGKDYIGLYDCKTCDTVPPLCWTNEFLNNPKCYIDQYNKYFKDIDNTGGDKFEINSIISTINTWKKEIGIYTSNKNGFNLKKKCIFLNENDFLNKSVSNNKIYIIDKIDKQSILFLEKLGKCGICAIANYSLPNCIPYKDIAHIFNKLISFIESINNRSTLVSRIKRLFANNCKKLDKPITTIPIYGRHDHARVVIQLLQKQTLETDIILSVSTEDDLKFAIDLKLDYVYSDNHPLSNKYQELLLYAKTYHSKYVFSIGSDDIPTLNYIKNCVDIMNNDKCDTVETSLFIIVEPHSLYKVTYTNKLQSCGAGRMFNSDTLDRINWSLYPLNLRWSIDSYANSIMNDNNFKRKIICDIENTIILIKNCGLDQITSSMNIINNSDYKIEKIFHPYYLILTLYVYNLQDIYKCLTDSFEKEIVYITDTNEDTLNTNFMCRLQKNIIQLMKHRANICDIRDLKKNSSIHKYKKYIIDGSCLDPATVKLTPNELKDLLLPIRKYNKIMLVHDTHDWSFGFNTEPPIPPFVPCLYDTPEKQLLKQLIIENNVKTVVAINNEAEVKFLRNYLGDCVDKVITNFHFIDSSMFNTFQFNRNLTKVNDILFYGTANPDVYPFRCRIKDICLKYGYNIKIIPREYKYNPDTCENGLSNHISKSWITIACVSNFKGSVRKYNEIALSGSVPLGDISEQLYNLNNGDMLLLDDNMSDTELNNVIYNYLNNKDLLVLLYLKSERDYQKYCDTKYINTLLEIADDNYINPLPINKKYIEEYEYIKELYNIYKLAPSQVCELCYNEFGFSIKIKQNVSTPGLQIIFPISTILNGDYLIVSEQSEHLNISFNTQYINYYTYIRINNITYYYFNVTNISNLIIYLTISNPVLNQIILFKHFTLYQFHKTIKKRPLYITSKGCPLLSEPISLYMNSHYISSNDLTNKLYSKIKNIESSDLLLFGLYDPQLWKHYYKDLFDSFKRIIIVFTGTDILQMCGKYFQYDNKFTPSQKNELITYLKNAKNIICASENEYIKTEIKQLHDIECEVLPIYTHHEITGYCNDIKEYNKIGVYMPRNGDNQWYHANIITEVAKKLPNIEFHFYNRNGYVKAANQENIPNIIACSEVTNFSKFMEDKFCSLRVTLHDGEPLTGIETLALGRHFIFNFPMKYATKCDPTIDSITQTINDIVDNKKKLSADVSAYYVTRYTSFSNAYTILNNTIGLNKIYCYTSRDIINFKPHKNIGKTLITENYINYVKLISNQKGSTPGIIIPVKLNINVKYTITVFGCCDNIQNKTTTYLSLSCLNQSGFETECRKHKIYCFYGPAQFIVKAKSTGLYELLFHFVNPRINDVINIEKIWIQS